MRNSSFSILFVLLSIVFPSYLQGVSSAEIIVEDGINALYNYEFEKAIALLDSAFMLDSSLPVLPFVLIAANWLHSQTQVGYDASYQKINEGVEATIPIYTALIYQYPSNAEYYLYLGSTYGIRARTALASKEWLDVLYFGYQGLKYIRKAEKMDPHLYDVYMPIGLMEYFACLSPKPVKLGAKLVGLSSDCIEGLHHLEIAAKESQYSWIEASNVLTYAYLHIERNYHKAEQIINPLVDRFPGHPYFTFLKAELLAKTNQWEELDELYTILYQFASKGPFLQQNECQLKLSYIEGLQAYFYNDFNRAIEKCNWILSNYHMEFDWLKGFAYNLRGQCYEELEDVELAILDYKEVLKMDDYYPEVNEAKRKIWDLRKL